MNSFCEPALRLERSRLITREKESSEINDRKKTNERKPDTKVNRWYQWMSDSLFNGSLLGSFFLTFICLLILLFQLMFLAPRHCVFLKRHIRLYLYRAKFDRDYQCGELFLNTVIRISSLLFSSSILFSRDSYESYRSMRAPHPEDLHRTSKWFCVILEEIAQSDHESTEHDQEDDDEFVNILGETTREEFEGDLCRTLTNIIRAREISVTAPDVEMPAGENRCERKRRYWQWQSDLQWHSWVARAPIVPIWRREHSRRWSIINIQPVEGLRDIPLFRFGEITNILHVSMKLCIIPISNRHDHLKRGRDWSSLSHPKSSSGWCPWMRFEIRSEVDIAVPIQSGDLGLLGDEVRVGSCYWQGWLLFVNVTVNH